jgi:hypothetical protein
MINELVLQYIDYATGIKNRPDLNENVRAQIMLQMAQALNVLVPLANPGEEQALQQQQQMDQAQQQHAQQMQMAQQKHQAELQKSAEKHQMDLAMKQQHHDLALQQAKMKASQKSEV